jgi:hypothetical protein
LRQEVHVEQPWGFIIEGEEDKAYRLKDAFYKLKQALKAWYSQIDGHFNEKCFLKSKNEPTMLVKR